MPTTKEISTEEALAFNQAHWPSHNRRQGIDWQQTRHALGVFEGETCMGVAYFSVVGGMGFLEQIVVADGHTKQGYGSAMLEAFEARVAELGCHVVQLETAETQAPGFYERHGYTRIGTYPNGRFHLDWHLYRKEISPGRP
ncbi:MAG: GNAT family N-acetyltransferase [Myxococcota bacterium]